MHTLRQLSAEPAVVPSRTAWYLADLGEARGKQELFTRQSPQKLKLLRENALIQSAVSSNRIEDVEVDKSRIGTLMFGKPALRGRDEEELRGYRADDWILASRFTHRMSGSRSLRAMAEKITSRDNTLLIRY